ncbi:MAG TPA: hypothetical protein VMV77_14445, partial [Bacteroidales bacterium]|nr:hypothetical protein [Bacteroidales bacterium]
VIQFLHQPYYNTFLPVLQSNDPITVRPLNYLNPLSSWLFSYQIHQVVYYRWGDYNEAAIPRTLFDLVNNMSLNSSICSIESMSQFSINMSNASFER